MNKQYMFVLVVFLCACLVSSELDSLQLVMGNNQVDSYFTQKPANAAAIFRKINLYYWIEPNIRTSHPARQCLQLIKTFAQIHHTQSWQAFIALLDSKPLPPSTQVYLIAPPTLPLLAYASCQSSERVHRIILLCINQKNTEIIPPYPKLSKPLLSYQQLVEQVRQLEACDRDTLHFFCEQEMERMNRWMFNWLVLQQGRREKGKAEFVSLMHQLTPHSADVKRYQSSYNLNKNQQQRDRMVLQWLRSNSFFLRIPSEFLSKMRDTFSLALVRQPLFDIYNTIRAQYALNSYPDVIAHATLRLNRREINRIKEGNFKYVYFSSYLICGLQQSNEILQSNEYRVVLILMKKSAEHIYSDCAGFYLDEQNKQAIINISNPFQVRHIDYQKRQICLQLVQIPKSDLNQPQEMINLQLHRRFLRYLVKILPGQILAAYFNKQLQTYWDFVNNDLSFLLSTTNNDLSLRKQTRQIERAKVKLYFRLESPKKIDKEVLEAKLIKLPNNCNPMPSKIKIYFLLIQVNFRINDFVKFGRCLNRLKEIFQTDSKSFSEQQVLKLKVYSIYAYICTNKSELEDNMGRLNEIQAISNTKMRDDCMVSELYTLIVLTRVKCAEIQGRHNKAYELLDSLIEITKICQGESQIYFQYEQIKLDMRIRARRSVAERQREEKRSLFASQISLEELPREPLQIPLSSLKLQMFEVVQNESKYFY